MLKLGDKEIESETELDGLCEADGLSDILSDAEEEGDCDELGLNETERLGLRDGEREIDKEGDDTSRASVTAYSLPYSRPYISHIYSACAILLIMRHGYWKHKATTFAVPVGELTFDHVRVNPSASKVLTNAVW